MLSAIDYRIANYSEISNSWRVGSFARRLEPFEVWIEKIELRLPKVLSHTPWIQHGELLSEIYAISIENAWWLYRRIHPMPLTYKPREAWPRNWIIDEYAVRKNLASLTKHYTTSPHAEYGLKAQ
jgi:hypothetical protein